MKHGWFRNKLYTNTHNACDVHNTKYSRFGRRCNKTERREFVTLYIERQTDRPAVSSEETPPNGRTELILNIHARPARPGLPADNQPPGLYCRSTQAGASTLSAAALIIDNSLDLSLPKRQIKRQQKRRESKWFIYIFSVLQNVQKSITPSFITFVWRRRRWRRWWWVNSCHSCRRICGGEFANLVSANSFEMIHNRTHLSIDFEGGRVVSTL